MKPLSPKQEELKTKWDARVHAKFDNNPGRYQGATAVGLAIATVHWHNNIEFDTIGQTRNDSSTFFCREYSRMATELWLWETLQKLEGPWSTQPTPEEYEEHSALHFDACNLRAALEAYEMNDNKPDPVMSVANTGPDALAMMRGLVGKDPEIKYGPPKTGPLAPSTFSIPQQPLPQVNVMAPIAESATKQ